jgi:hypothetical protein
VGSLRGEGQLGGARGTRLVDGGAVALGCEALQWYSRLGGEREVRQGRLVWPASGGAVALGCEALQWYSRLGGEREVKQGRLVWPASGGAAAGRCGALDRVVSALGNADDTTLAGSYVGVRGLQPGSFIARITCQAGARACLHCLGKHRWHSTVSLACVKPYTPGMAG